MAASCVFTTAQPQKQSRSWKRELFGLILPPTLPNNARLPFPVSFLTLLCKRYLLTISVVSLRQAAYMWTAAQCILRQSGSLMLKPRQQVTDASGDLLNAQHAQQQKQS